VRHFQSKTYRFGCDVIVNAVFGKVLHIANLLLKTHLLSSKLDCWWSYLRLIALIQQCCAM